MTSPHAPTSPNLDREEPDFWVEDDIPTPAADDFEDREEARGGEQPQR